MKYRVGLIIGRFQPFHRGHLYLVKKALGQADRLVIGIGSANVNDEKNPFSFEERKAHIETSLKRNNLLDKIIKIVSLDDYPDDDDLWLEEVKKKVGEFDASFGNNEWTNGILEERGVKVISFPLFKRDKYEGVKIREEMRKSKDPKKVLRKHLP